MQLSLVPMTEMPVDSEDNSTTVVAAEDTDTAGLDKVDESVSRSESVNAGVSGP